MLSRWPVRKKLQLGVAILCLIVGLLAFSGFKGVYAFRELTKSIRARALELPLASELTQSVSELRLTLSVTRQDQYFSNPIVDGHDQLMMGSKFRQNFVAVKDTLSRYKAQLDSVQVGDKRIANNEQERRTVREVERVLATIETLSRAEHWHYNEVPFRSLDYELEQLQELTSQLPGYMTSRMDAFANQSRIEYRTWIIMSWTTTILAGIMLFLLLRFFQLSIFRPLRLLLDGSRRVASGDFAHRIHVNTHDEVAELAAAMNQMTSRFQEIRDDLDAQVQQRTKEVVRSEQLASVGFLAAGVAHEINNPLASIAWAAESLESRVHDIVAEDDQKPDEQHNEEISVLRKYLRRIQDEAFRCKGITEKLLDFSRLGDHEKHDSDLCAILNDVIEMVQHLGIYRNKHIRFDGSEPVMARVNPQEIKQVALNLITNAMDSLDPQGIVELRLRKVAGNAELIVKDNGCGMTDEVREHLFEPFFTRRRNGQGTGLGLSITYRIVEDHGGRIEAHSDGPGKGAQFRVTIPLIELPAKNERQRSFQAA